MVTSIGELLPLFSEIKLLAAVSALSCLAVQSDCLCHLLGPFHGAIAVHEAIAVPCHALSLSSLLSWTLMRRRRVTVLLATSGEWA